ATDLQAQFVIHNDFGSVSNLLTINDSADEKVTNFTVNNGAVTTTDGSLRVQVTGHPFGRGVSLLTGSAGNSVTVLGTRKGEPLTLDTRDGLDVVNIGNGSVQNIRGNVIVKNPRSFSDLFVDNSEAANFSADVVISPTGILGLAPAMITYAPAEIQDMEVFGGTSPSTYRVTGSFAGSFLYLDTSAGKGRVVLGNNGVVNDGLFPGLVLLAGGGKTDLGIDNSRGGAAKVTTSDDGLDGLITAGLEFADLSSVGVVLGRFADQLTVSHTEAGTPPRSLLGGGDDGAVVAALDSPLTVAAGAGNDLMLGGVGKETFVLGPGTDRVIGRGGDDTVVWSFGAGNALVDGGAGNSTLVVNG